MKETSVEIVSDGTKCRVSVDRDQLTCTELFELIGQCVVGAGYSQVNVDEILGE